MSTINCSKNIHLYIRFRFTDIQSKKIEKVSEDVPGHSIDIFHICFAHWAFVVAHGRRPRAVALVAKAASQLLCATQLGAQQWHTSPAGCQDHLSRVPALR